MENSVQTMLTISNTDIVTMLIVKQKEILKERLHKLEEERVEIEDKYVDKIQAILEERYKENESLAPLKEAYTTLGTIYNPGVSFSIELADPLYFHIKRRIGGLFRNFRMYGPTVEKGASIPCLPEMAFIVGEKDAPFFVFPNGQETFSLVEKEYEEKDEYVKLAKEDYETLIKINIETEKIAEFQRDDKKLHEHIVAKMTERAISANVGLQAVVSDFKLIE